MKSSAETMYAEFASAAGNREASKDIYARKQHTNRSEYLNQTIGIGNLQDGCNHHDSRDCVGNAHQRSVKSVVNLANDIAPDHYGQGQD